MSAHCLPPLPPLPADAATAPAAVVTACRRRCLPLLLLLLLLPLLLLLLLLLLLSQLPASLVLPQIHLLQGGSRPGGGGVAVAVERRCGGAAASGRSATCDQHLNCPCQNTFIWHCFPSLCVPDRSLPQRWLHRSMQVVGNGWFKQRNNKQTAAAKVKGARKHAGAQHELWLGPACGASHCTRLTHPPPARPRARARPPWAGGSWSGPGCGWQTGGGYGCASASAPRCASGSCRTGGASESASGCRGCGTGCGTDAGSASASASGCRAQEEWVGKRARRLAGVRLGRCLDAIQPADVPSLHSPTQHRNEAQAPA